MSGNARMGNNTLAILGGRGMLGSDLAKACLSQGWAINVLDLPDFDITKENQLKNAIDQEKLFEVDISKYLIFCPLYAHR